jgi:Leucine-rich repeat (LRR) protein
VDFNHRIAIPKKFENSLNLSLLVSSYNKINRLSDSIISLKKLKMLGLSSNDISDLPLKSRFPPYLRYIELEGDFKKYI